VCQEVVNNEVTWSTPESYTGALRLVYDIIKMEFIVRFWFRTTI